MGSADHLLANRYELRGVLGRGGMAEVRDGWDTRLSRPVAIKLLQPGLAADVVMRRRFEDEARAAAALNHPNIVVVHDTGEHHGTPFLVMERLPGPTLADEIAAGPLTSDRVRWVLADLLGALTAAHGAGILHRDIKPGNVLISATGNAKLSDFGLAKTVGAAHTQAGIVFGTPDYLSPQRITGQPASVSDDLYALGVLGYEALTGRRPFDRGNPIATMRAVVDEAAMPLLMVRPDVDPALAHVLESAMSRDPAYRFPDAASMRAALSGASPPRPATLVLPTPLPPRRSRLRLALGTLAVMAAVILGAVLLIADPPPQRAPVTPGTPSVAPAAPVAPVEPVEPTVPVATSIPTVLPTMPEDAGDHGNGKGRGHGKGHDKKNRPHE